MFPDYNMLFIGGLHSIRYSQMIFISLSKIELLERVMKEVLEETTQKTTRKTTQNLENEENIIYHD